LAPDAVSLLRRSHRRRSGTVKFATLAEFRRHDVRNQQVVRRLPDGHHFRHDGTSTADGIRRETPRRRPAPVPVVPDRCRRPVFRLRLSQRRRAAAVHPHHHHPETGDRLGVGDFVRKSRQRPSADRRRRRFHRIVPRHLLRQEAARRRARESGGMQLEAVCRLVLLKRLLNHKSSKIQ